MKTNKETIFTNGKNDFKKTEKEIEKIKFKLKKNKKIYLVFDLDGVLIPAGIETPATKLKLDSFVKKNKSTVLQFNAEIKKLKKKGYLVAIDTGRGEEFVKKVIKRIFPKNTVDVIVCEMGSIKFEYTKKGVKHIETKKYAQGLNKKLLAKIKKVKEQIETYALRTLKAKKEKKEIIISLYSPRRLSFSNFSKTLNKYLKEKGFLELFEISSGIAMDIRPKGTNKKKALKNTIGKSEYFFFGDSDPDRVAIKNSLGSIAPGNSSASTKAEVRKTKIGILPKKDHLFGTLESLKNLNELF